MKVLIKIESIDDWEKRFPPAGKEKQWKDNYSAKEFAKIVTDTYEGSNFEKEIAQNLGFDESFQIFSEETYPEQLSRFDDNYRGPRHHDLACIAKVNDKKIALCFEAKVNESLDKQLAKYRNSDGRKKRVDTLLTHFCGSKYAKEIHGKLYYQILSGIAGSIAFAAENMVDDVYFILYQIKPTKNNKPKHIDSHIAALNDFISLFPGKNKIDKNNNFVNLGELSIERKYDAENRKNEEMKANVTIVYMEKEVSGSEK